MKDKPLLGLCPIGKFVFSHEDAIRYKAVIEEKLHQLGVNFVNIDDVVTDGIIRSQNDVEQTVLYLKNAGVDSIFMPHCNFGTEGAAGMIGREMGVPALLWGPRDEAPLSDGTRLRDSLCGLFATSKVLHKLGVQFTYIENCRPDDDVFITGVDTFYRAANVVKKARRMRIGQIGQRIDFFWTTIINESELLERFGIEIVPIDMVEFIEKVKKLAVSEHAKYLEEIDAAKKRIRFEGFSDSDSIVNIYAVRDAMLNLAADLQLDVISIQSFMSICDALGCMVEYSTSMVEDAGVPVACESDIHGAISSVLLKAASLGQESILFADLTIRHPDNDNSVLLWHCGFPESLRKPGDVGYVGTHWILPDIAPGSCHWEMKEGPITVFRFDGDRGVYEAVSGEGHTVVGPKTQNTYVWMEVRDWPQWERMFINGPFIHHVSCCYGQYSRVLREASRYIPGLNYSQLP